MTFNFEEYLAGNQIVRMRAGYAIREIRIDQDPWSPVYPLEVEFIDQYGDVAEVSLTMDGRYAVAADATTSTNPYDLVVGTQVTYIAVRMSLITREVSAYKVGHVHNLDEARQVAEQLTDATETLIQVIEYMED